MKQLSQRQFQILADNALDFCDGDPEKAFAALVRTLAAQGIELPDELPPADPGVPLMKPEDRC